MSDPMAWIVVILLIALVASLGAALWASHSADSNPPGSADLLRLLEGANDDRDD